MQRPEGNLKGQPFPRDQVSLDFCLPAVWRLFISTSVLSGFQRCEVSLLACVVSVLHTKPSSSSYSTTIFKKPRIREEGEKGRKRREGGERRNLVLSHLLSETWEEGRGGDTRKKGSLSAVCGCKPVFMSTRHRPEPIRKREPKLKECPHQSGLKASRGANFKLVIDGGGPRS